MHFQKRTWQRGLNAPLLRLQHADLALMSCLDLVVMRER